MQLIFANRLMSGFAPKATQVLHFRRLSRWARTRTHALQHGQIVKQVTDLPTGA